MYICKFIYIFKDMNIRVKFGIFFGGFIFGVIVIVVVMILIYRKFKFLSIKMYVY